MTDEVPRDSASGLSAREVYYILFRHKWLILLSSLLGLVAAVGIWVRTPTMYTSEAKLLVRYVAERTGFDAEVRDGQIISPTRSGDSIVNSEVEILGSRDLVESTLDELDARSAPVQSSNLESRAGAVANAAQNLQITVQRNSSVIRVAFTAANPALAQEFLMRLVSKYLDKHNEIHRSASAYEFLSQQTDQIRSRLIQTEEELGRMYSAAGVMSVAEGSASLSARQKELQTAIQGAEAELAATKARVQFIRSQSAADASSSASVFRPHVGGGASEDSVALRGLLEKEGQLLAAFAEDSIPIREIRRQIAIARAGLRVQPLPEGAVGDGASDGGTGAVAAAVSPSMFDEQVTTAALEARLVVLREQMRQVKTETESLDRVADKIGDLERRKEIQAANYKYFVESLERARIDDALDTRRQSSISVVQPATFPAGAIMGAMRRQAVIALVLGVLGGLALAFLREYVFDHSLRRPRDMEAVFGVPTLISIPRSDLAPLLHGDRPATAGLLTASAGEAGGRAGVWPADSEIGDYCEALRDRVIWATEGVGSRPIVLGVAGCQDASGVSTVATALALGLARNSEDRVLLVDGNPAHHAANRIFGVDSRTGLTEIQMDSKGNTAVVQTSVYVMSTTADERPPPRGAAGAMEDLIRRLRGASAAFVVLDLPPVTDTSLTPRVARLLDGVLLVVEAEKVDRAIAAHARRLLEQAQAKIIGTVLNKRRRYVPAWLSAEA